MSIHVFIDQFKIGLIEAKAYDALKQTGYVLRDDIREEQIVPRMHGFLQGEKFLVDTSNADKGLVQLVFEGPYARRLYYHPEYKFHREPWTDSKGNTYEGNPHAQGMWLVPWLKGGKYEKRPQEIYEGFLKRSL